MASHASSSQKTMAVLPVGLGATNSGCCTAISRLSGKMDRQRAERLDGQYLAKLRTRQLPELDSRQRPGCIETNAAESGSSDSHAFFLDLSSRRC